MNTTNGLNEYKKSVMSTDPGRIQDQSDLNSFGDVAASSKGVLSSLHNFFNNIGEVSNKIGAEDAILRGRQNASDNMEKLIINTQKKQELEKSLLNASEDEKPIIEANIRDIDAQNKEVQKGANHIVTMNLMEQSMHNTQAQMYGAYMNTQYNNTIQTVYEKFKDNPAGFREASKKVSEKFLEQVPKDQHGSYLEEFDKVTSQVAFKVHQNFITKQKQILKSRTNEVLDSNIDMASKISYEGGDPSIQINNILKSLQSQFDQDIITPDQFRAKKNAAIKLLRTNKLDGEFDRTYGYKNDPTFVPSPQQIEKGVGYIAQYKEYTKVLPNETPEEYKQRVGLSQSEQAKLMQTWENKIKVGQSRLNTFNKNVVKIFNSQAKTAYKMMDKGVKPDNFDMLKAQASKNPELAYEFKSHESAMNLIQYIHDLPLKDREEYINTLDKNKVTGQAPIEFNTRKTVEADISKTKALAKSDPIQLAENEGLVHKMPGSIDGIAKELKYRDNVVTSGQLLNKYDVDPKSLISNSEATQLNTFMENNPDKVLPLVATFVQSIGPKNTNNILSKINTKKPSAIVYAAYKYSEDPLTSARIMKGHQLLLNGFSLDSDAMNEYKTKKTDYNALWMNMGDTAKGAQEAVYDYYVTMSKPDYDTAVKSVIGNIDEDTGLILPKGTESYSDLIDKIKDENVNNVMDEIKPKKGDRNRHRISTNTQKTFIENFREKLSGEPMMKTEVLRQKLFDDELILHNASHNSYYFTTRSTGATIKDTDGKLLIFNYGDE